MLPPSLRTGRQVVLLALALLGGWLAPAAAQQPLRATAVAGKPFGVARLEMPTSLAGAFAPGRKIHVTDAAGRVHYPVSRSIKRPQGEENRRERDAAPERGIGRGQLLSRLSRVIRNATEEETQQAVGREVWFLFEGDQPLELRLSGGASRRIELVPEQRPIAAHRELLEGWWETYCAKAEARIESEEYPPIVETYLVSMLSRRLGLAPVGNVLAAAEERDNEVASTLEMVGGTERLQTAIFRRAAAGDTERLQSADQPLPPPPAWAPSSLPEIEEEVAIEPIAHRVPPECLYLRFGSFQNYLWFKDLSSDYGGDISRMISLRPFDYGGSRRLEKQLAVQMTQMSRLMGPSVIDDQAVIGRDLFFANGASLGVLMKAKNAFLLRTSLNAERSNVASGSEEVTLTTETIAGNEVTFLSSPDNRVRSFLAIDGEWFLITNSRTLARRFFEVGGEADSLADSREFRLARRLMPLERNDTIFAYLSSAMLRGLVSPKYQIELRRRLFSSADIALVHLARLASQADGQPIEAIDALIREGYLPDAFGRRPDGGGPISVGDEVVDSRRGGRGTFLPIADTTISAVTQEEAAWYEQRAAYYSEHWKQMDPLLVGVQRSALPAADGGGDGEAEAAAYERLQIHAEIAPLVPEKYGKIARQLGPPTREALRFAPDDLAGVQAHVVSDQLQGSIPPHHLFAGVKDATPPDPTAVEGILQTYFALRMLPAYLGAWPQPGLLDRLPLGLGQGRAIGPNMSRLLGGIYRYHDGGFSVLSFQYDLLVATLPHLTVTEAEEPAQVRAFVKNLVGSQMEGWVNEQLYKRARQASLSGTEFLDVFSSQLKVEDAPAAAEQVLNARLQCPLGGHYLATEEGGAVQWVSTAWGSDVPSLLPPEDYLAPLLTWFRGLQANLTQYPDRAVVDATIDTERVGRGPSRTGPPTEPRSEPPRGQ